MRVVVHMILYLHVLLVTCQQNNYYIHAGLKIKDVTATAIEATVHNNQYTRVHTRE